MRILVYADLQADYGSERLFSATADSLRLWCVAKFYEEMRQLYTAHRCDGVIDLGDTFDNRNSIDVPTLRTVLAGIDWLAANSRNTRIIGNHDQFLRNGAIHNGPVLAHKFNVVSDRVIEVVDNTRFFFCAYPKDHAELAQWIKTEAAKVRGRKILFGHFQVKGAYLNNTQTTSGVPLEALSSFDLVLLGHIHQPQSLSDRIYYVGSPFQQDWGEAGQKKRVLIVDTERLKVTSVPLEHYPEYRVIDLPEFKKAAQQPGEHRYRVVLKNHKESTEFFTHPAFHRAVAQYDYDISEAEDGQPEPEKDWSFDGSLLRYMKQVPPSGAGVDLKDEEMLEMGKTISKSD